MSSHYTGKSAFLELGSTSIKYYLVSFAGEIEFEEKVPWELGYDVFEHGRISPRSITRCLTTLRRLESEHREVPLASVTAVGTAALREAQNSEVFLRVLQEETGLRLHVIEGGIEAFLLETGFRGMVERYPTGLFDLGGGSLELIEYLNPVSTRKTSVPIGAVRLHCQLRRTRDILAYVREGRRLLATTVAEYLEDHLPRYEEWIGTGGTVRAVVGCLESDAFAVQDVERLIQREIHGPVWSEMAPHRRKLFLPGLLAIESVFTVLGAERIVYRTASVKRGLISFMSMLPSA